jgi:mannose-1-phosphate guanylyltransferase
VVTDGEGRVREFVEKSPEVVTDQVNAGTYVFNRSLIDEIPAGQVVSVERDTFPSLLASGAAVRAHVDNAYWLDVGTPSAFAQASADLVRGLVASPAVESTGTALVMPGASVDSSATVGAGTVVDTDAVVGAGAVVEASVVLPGARVDAGAVVFRSVLGVGSVVGADCQVSDAVVGDGARLGPRNELCSGARVWPDVVLPGVALRFSTDA